MTNPASNLRMVSVYALELAEAWYGYNKAIDELAEPSLGGGSGGKSSGISDPTGTAAAAGERWTQHRRQITADTARLLADSRRLDRKMREITSVATNPSPEEKASMRCSGEHDPTCETLASVGPTGRPDRNGMCIRCAKARQRASK